MIPPMIERRWTDPETGMIGRATFSPDEQYRYALGRRWEDDGIEPLMFLMCNPSKATHEVLDWTVGRCVSYAKAWGYSALVVGNIFGLRSTDPRQLVRHHDPVGPQNNEHILRLARASATVVCAWGAWGQLWDRGEEVRQNLVRAGVTPYCLDTTSGGYPRHPRGLTRDLTPVPYRGLSAAVAKEMNR